MLSMLANASIQTIATFLSGAVMMAAWVIGIFFLRFYRRTRDRFFLMFSLAFFVMGLNTIILSLLVREDEYQAYVYMVRLLAFLLILAAIIDKNRSRKTMS